MFRKGELVLFDQRGYKFTVLVTKDQVNPPTFTGTVIDVFSKDPAITSPINPHYHLDCWDAYAFKIITCSGDVSQEQDPRDRMDILSDNLDKLIELCSSKEI